MSKPVLGVGGPGVAVRAILAWSIVAACGDNTEPVAALDPATDLTIVAHQDDDLLFMQPDLADAIQRGTGVTTVYVTAGNGTGAGGFKGARRRYAGVMAAYGAMAGSSKWTCGRISIAGHDVGHCRLEAAKVSLVFLGYPDGGLDGQVPDSLLHLWQGKADYATTVARRPATYHRDDLVAVLAEIIDATAPDTVRTLEIAATHGHDHADHMMAGALAMLATAASSRSPELISYRGYNIDGEPANAAPQAHERGVGVIAFYEACVTHCAPCGTACAASQVQAPHVAWLERHYAVGMRHPTEGALRLGEACVDASSGAPAMVDCAAAPSWTLDARGTLRSSAGCLRVQADGVVAAVRCGASGPGDRFFLDDDGHLWSGQPPIAADVAPDAHALCLTVEGDRPHARVCGAGHAPRWELARAMTLADPGADHAAHWVADLDGDHQPDWCAASPAGPLCRLSSDDTAPTTTTTPWGYAFGGTVEGAATSGVLDSPDAEVIADIDGDGRADLCAAGAGTIACARSLGHGFGPRTVIARLPAGMTATTLWAEPAVLCASDGATTACTDRP